MCVLLFFFVFLVETIITGRVQFRLAMKLIFSFPLNLISFSPSAFANAMHFFTVSHTLIYTYPFHSIPNGFLLTDMHIHIHILCVVVCVSVCLCVRIYFHFECSEHRLTRSFASLFGKCFILLFFTTACLVIIQTTHIFTSALTYTYIVHHTSHRHKHRQHKASAPLRLTSLPSQTPPSPSSPLSPLPCKRRQRL